MQIYYPLLITASLHQFNLTCGSMQMYPGQVYPHPPSLTLVLQSPTTPCEFDMWKNVDIPSSDVSLPLLINLSGTEPYYTMSVWHVEECTHTQVRCTPPPELTLVVQSPTTPCQFDICKNLDICRSHIPPPQWTLAVQSPDTPWQFHMWNNAGIPTSDVYPPQIEPSATQPYHTISVSYVEECRCTQVICTLPSYSPHHKHHIVEESNIMWHHISICYIDMCEMQK